MYVRPASLGARGVVYCGNGYITERLAADRINPHSAFFKNYLVTIESTAK